MKTDRRAAPEATKCEDSIEAVTSTRVESLRPPGLPSNLPPPDWQKQKSYRKAQEKAVRRLHAFCGYVDRIADEPYPLIKWSGTAPRSDRGGITGGEYLW
jgi:hypothetical protein